MTPFSEKTRSAKLQEAQGAIQRLEATMSQGDNRFGEYGRNCREAIARWRQTIAELQRPATEPTEQGLQYVIPGCEKDRSRGPKQADMF